MVFKLNKLLMLFSLNRREFPGLLNLAQELGNVSKACKVMGISRDTFYRYQQSVEEGGVDALINQSRKVPNHKKRVDPGIEKAIIFYAIEY